MGRSDRTIRNDDDLLVTPVMRERLKLEGEFEGGPGQWWGVFMRSNGLLIPAGSSAAMPVPEDAQKMFAFDMAEALNRHLHHDGKWIVAFTHPSGAIYGAPSVVLNLPMEFERWLFLWVDRDGDPQFTMDNDDVFTETLLAGPDHWLEQAEQAWQKWEFHMRDVLDIPPEGEEGLTIKRAQGERYAPVKH